MPRFAVGIASLFTNELDIEIVEAPNWMIATLKHSAFSEEGGLDKEFLPAEETLTVEGVKRRFFDGDMLFDIKEIA